ncbi:hypothetical protein SGFS_031290 [Streptomyces graminofaciens]|uniref:Secreted protein n=1 Tax=Streptomyces graminofaciens TaxID=68212 RepID=A0ABM7F7I4_9ACTN|nr:hypothetical protein SGFS_031290 [Streptomyces graminofaciens]
MSVLVMISVGASGWGLGTSAASRRMPSWARIMSFLPVLNGGVKQAGGRKKASHAAGEGFAAARSAPDTKVKQGRTGGSWGGEAGWGDPCRASGADGDTIAGPGVRPLAPTS